MSAISWPSSCADAGRNRQKRGGCLNNRHTKDHTSNASNHNRLRATHQYRPYRVPQSPAAGTSSNALPHRTKPPWSCWTHNKRTLRQQSGNLGKYESGRMMNCKHEHTPTRKLVFAHQQLHHIAIITLTELISAASVMSQKHIIPWLSAERAYLLQ